MSKHPWVRGLSVLATVLALKAAVGSMLVRAETAEDRVEARRRFEQAEHHYKQNRFAEALVEYEAGYLAAPLPGFLVNIAQCHRMMGELRKARAHYRKFVLVSPQSSRRQEVEDIIKLLDAAIAQAQGAPTGGETPSAGPRTGGDPRRAAESDSARAPEAARTGAARWRMWTAVASSVVGSTVANLTATAATGAP